MHLIKDENGNLVQHGHADSHEHTHEHTHEDGVTHSHTHSHAEGDSHCHTHGDGHCGSCESGDCKNETVALLTYMLQHNEHHAAELDQMADNLKKLNMDAAAKIFDLVKKNRPLPADCFPEYPRTNHPLIFPHRKTFHCIPLPARFSDETPFSLTYPA